MVKITDSLGNEREALVAEKEMIVIDPLYGFSRRIMAGEPVPADLEAAYKEKAPPKKARKVSAASAKKGAGKKAS